MYVLLWCTPVSRGDVRLKRTQLTVVLVAAIPPTIYYSKVAFEVSKLIFNGQRMAPP